MPVKQLAAPPKQKDSLNMARSTCMKCGHTKFELVQNTPKDSNFKLYFVQCASCGGVVGVQEWDNIGALIHRLAKALKISLP